jgi:hypothetical protein
MDHLPGSGPVAPHDARLPGVDCGLSAVSQVQLVEDVGEVALDVLFTDHQHLGDGLVVLTAGDLARSVSWLYGLTGSSRLPCSSLTMRAATRGLSTASPACARTIWPAPRV